MSKRGPTNWTGGTSAFSSVNIVQRPYAIRVKEMETGQVFSIWDRDLRQANDAIVFLRTVTAAPTASSCPFTAPLARRVPAIMWHNQVDCWMWNLDLPNIYLLVLCSIGLAREFELNRSVPTATRRLNPKPSHRYVILLLGYHNENHFRPHRSTEFVFAPSSSCLQGTEITGGLFLMHFRCSLWATDRSSRRELKIPVLKIQHGNLFTLYKNV